MKHRFTELDAIRGIAVLMVVLFHYTARYGDLYGLSIDPLFSFGLGKYGVQLFFIVSGFVIFLTLEKTRHAADFVVSRFARLYPAYWAAIVLTYGVLEVFTLPGREVSVEAALINLSMIQTWLRVSHVDGVYWTLAIELSFYFVMLILYMTGLLKRVYTVCTVWLLIIIAARLLEKFGGVPIHWAIKMGLLLNFGNLFIAGIMFYKIMHKPAIAAYGILGLALLAEAVLHGRLVVLVAGYFGLFYLFTQGRLQALAVRPLIYLGTISYSLYLIHQNIGYVIIRALENSDYLNPVTLFVVPMAVSLAIAGLMQTYIEKPSLKLIRNLWNKSRAREWFTGVPLVRA